MRRSASHGNYTVTVKASHHKNSLGEYNIHLYYVQDNGQLVGVGGTTTIVSKAQPKGMLKIENNNPDTGSFDVVFLVFLVLMASRKSSYRPGPATKVVMTDMVHSSQTGGWYLSSNCQSSKS